MGYDHATVTLPYKDFVKLEHNHEKFTALVDEVERLKNKIAQAELNGKPHTFAGIFGIDPGLYNVVRAEAEWPNPNEEIAKLNKAIERLDKEIARVNKEYQELQVQANMDAFLVI